VRKFTISLRDRDGAAFWFSRLATNIRRRVEWADDPDVPIPYDTTLLGRVAMHGPGIYMIDIADLIDAGELPKADS
jgi:hypothetical protein